MTGKQRQIEIWFVKYEDKYYVISERREKAHWVQNIIHDPKVSFTVGDKKNQWQRTNSQQRHGVQVSLRGFKING